jgi:hypothetical protein
MNKGRTVKFNIGDEISYAQPSGMLYGEVIRILDAGEAGAIEIQFEDGRKEVKKVRDSALSLLRRASGKSEEEERHQDRQKLRDPELEKVIRSEQRRRW